MWARNWLTGDCAPLQVHVWWMVLNQDLEIGSKLHPKPRAMFLNDTDRNIYQIHNFTSIQTQIVTKMKWILLIHPKSPDVCGDTSPHWWLRFSKKTLDVSSGLSFYISVYYKSNFPFNEIKTCENVNDRSERSDGVGSVNSKKWVIVVGMSFSSFKSFKVKRKKKQNLCKVKA